MRAQWYREIEGRDNARSQINMRLILIGGEKGGSGKTTTCIELACCAVEKGCRVLVVDGDAKQASAFDWLMHRSELIEAAKAGNEELMPDGVSARVVEKLKSPDVVKLDSKSFWTDLKDVVSSYDLILFDVPGYDSPEIKSALAIVDLALFPLKPSALDMRSAGGINERVGEYLGDGFPLISAHWVFVETMPPTKTRPETAFERELAGSISKSFENLSIANQRIALRMPFRAATWGGYCVADGLHPKESSWENGRLEIESLLEEVEGRLGLERKGKSTKRRAAA